MEFSLEEELAKSSEEQADFDQQIQLGQLSVSEITAILNRQLILSHVATPVPESAL